LTYSALSNNFKNHGKTEAENLKWEYVAENVRNIYNNILQKNHPKSEPNENK
jgi:hypothetical protein